jgi:hypothetical protein
MRGKSDLPSAERHPIAVTQMDNRLSEEHISVPDANPATEVLSRTAYSAWLHSIWSVKLSTT